ncbi:MAG: translocation/assembly module TamB [Bacteroidales bacterium]|nr:translocation/assembly module TamB [Bacteroidales bacterium]MCF8333877.1 translocation/assembly module TamB [Bacteroidales bacterium]
MISNEIQTPFRVEKVKLGYFLRIEMENVVALDDYYDTLLQADKLALRVSEIDRQAKTLRFNDIRTQNLDFHLIKHEGDTDLNIKYITDRLKDTTSSDSWNFEFMDVALSNARFRLDDKNETPETGKADFNHLDVQGLQSRIQNLKVVNDTISAWIKYLSGKEKSGFQLNDMEAHIKLSPTGWKGDYVRINTPNSHLFLDFVFDYYDYNDLSDFVNAVYMDTKLYDCRLSTADLQYFVPQLPETDNQLEVKGSLNGRLNDIAAKDLRLQYGEDSRFRGDIAIEGVTDIKNAFFDAQVENFSTTDDDIALFAFTEKKALPEPLNKIETIQFDGFFKGRMFSFTSKAHLKTNLGKVSADVSMSRDSTQKPSYEGTITGDSVLLGTILGKPSDLGSLNFHTKINGKGLDKNLEAHIEGYVNRFQLRGNTFDSLMIQGNASSQKFSGDLHLKDESINFDFSGLADLSKKNIHFDFQSKIQHADLNALKIPNKSDSLSKFSSKIRAYFAGNNLDSLSGIVAMNDITYRQDNFVYSMDTLMVEAEQRKIDDKKISIKSGVLDGNVSGQFSLSEIGTSFTNFMHKYLPDIFEYDSVDLAKQDFAFEFQLKDTRGLSNILVPQLAVSQGSSVKGHYSSDPDSISLETRIDTLTYNNIIFRDLRFSTGDKTNYYGSNLKVSEVILKEYEEEDKQHSLGMERFGLTTKVKDSQVSYNLNWDDFEKSDKNKATIQGHIDFKNTRAFTHQITESNIRINDTLWQVDPQNHITVTDTSTVFSEITIFTEHQRIKLDGTLSDNPDDKFGLDFYNFNLSDLDVLLASSSLDIDGVLNGYLNFNKVGEKSRFTGDIEVDRFYINNKKMGKFSLYSNWDDSLQKLSIEGDIVYKGNVGERTLLKVGGGYWPKIGSENDSLSFASELNNFSVSALEPLFDDFLNSISGMASGELNLKGSTQKPVLTGEVDLMRSRLRMSYLKTQYSFADKIKLRPDAIVFDSIKIYDSLGNPAVLNGKINHRYFNDFVLDLHLDTRNFAGLNTTRLDNDLFYGKAFATGRVDITGPVDDIELNVNAQTEPNTNVVIPISTSQSVMENDFIVFMENEKQNTKQGVSLQKVDVGGLNMNFELEITNDAEAEIILPFSMGSITGRGNGNLRMEITSSGEFNMYGDYIIEEGSFLFSLQNMLRRDFSIQRGGRISWNGNPYDATLDITALYRVRPTLKGLPASQSLDPALANERIPVNCIINLKDKLFNPNIKFDIELPSSDNRVKEIVYSSIDTTSTAEMNRQMIYLLVLNSFSVSGMDNTFSSGLGGSSLDLLSNQISSWLSQISRDFDVGINYRPGDDYTSEELEVALSTQLFDDRVSIDGNFGVTNMQQQTQANNMVGDIDVEVKITKDGRFRVKAFNQTNNVDLLDVGAPYTQGLGVFYRKEFDSLNELFRKKVREENNGVPQ